jgi:hypothetical protein
MPATPPRPVEPSDEPLAESAGLAWKLAPELCWRDPRSGERCDWYHGVWQLLRWLGLITSVRTNAPFFVETFAELARRGGFRRVLVCGAADYGMLAHVLHGFRSAGAEPEVAVLDRCETPLVSCRWYAARVGAAVATFRSDVLDWEPAGTFDVVCNHSFLGPFPAEARPELAARWRAWLRPGGALVTEQTVKPAHPDRPNRFSPAEADAFVARAVAAARSREADLPLPLGDFERAVRLYTERRVRNPVRSPDEVLAPLRGAGFALARSESGGERERAIDRPAGPASPGSYRLRIVALREGTA